MRILVLEDDKERIKIFARELFNHTVDFVEHASEAIELLKLHEYDTIFLDHDLGGTQMNFDPEDCGTLVAEYMRDNNITTKTIIHSFNSPAANNMLGIIPNAVYVPGAWSML